MMTQARGHHYHPHSQVLDDNDPAKGLSDINMCHEWPFIVMPGVSESVESEQRSLDTTQPGQPASDTDPCQTSESSLSRIPILGAERRAWSRLSLVTGQW